MRLVQPSRTIKYEVCSSDSLAHIALQFNTTPAELSRLNHLSSSLLYPGQTLFVPDKVSTNDEGEGGVDTDTDAGEHVALLEKGGAIPVPSNTPQKQSTSSPRLSFSPDKNLDHLLSAGPLDCNDDDQVSTKYLKVKSKYVTDGQGVVSGVLLVTPQTVMFNPCVSDHLVMERGREMYLVRLPLRAIARVALFEDVAAMVSEDLSKQYIPKETFIDYASEQHVSPKPGMIVRQQTGELYGLPDNDDGTQ